MRFCTFFGLAALAALVIAAPASAIPKPNTAAVRTNSVTRHEDDRVGLSLADVVTIFQRIKEVFDAIKAKITAGELEANILDFLDELEVTVAAKIARANPIVEKVLAEVKLAITDLIAKVKVDAEAGIEGGVDILVQLLDNIGAKLTGTVDEIAGYNIFGDIYDSIFEPILKGILDGFKDFFSSKEEEKAIAAVVQRVKDALKKLQFADVKKDLIESIGDVKNAGITLVTKTKSLIQSSIQDTIELVTELVTGTKINAEAVIVKLKNVILEQLKWLIDTSSSLKSLYPSDAFKLAAELVEEYVPILIDGLKSGNVVDKTHQILDVLYYFFSDAMDEERQIVENFRYSLEELGMDYWLLLFYDIMTKQTESLLEAVLRTLGGFFLAVTELKDVLFGCDKLDEILIPAMKRAIDFILQKMGKIKGVAKDFDVYNFLLNDILQPALKLLMESLAEIISNNLGPLKPIQYISGDGISSIMEPLKNLFQQIKSKVDSGELDENTGKALQAAQKLAEDVFSLLIKIMDGSVEGYNVFDILIPLLPLHDAIPPKIKDIIEKIKSGKFKTEIINFVMALKAILQGKIDDTKPEFKNALSDLTIVVRDLLAHSEANFKDIIETLRRALLAYNDYAMNKIAGLKDKKLVDVFDAVLGAVKPILDEIQYFRAEHAHIEEGAMYSGPLYRIIVDLYPLLKPLLKPIYDREETILGYAWDKTVIIVEDLWEYFHGEAIIETMKGKRYLIKWLKTIRVETRTLNNLLKNCPNCDSLLDPPYQRAIDGIVYVAKLFRLFANNFFTLDNLINTLLKPAIIESWMESIFGPAFVGSLKEGIGAVIKGIIDGIKNLPG